MFVVAHVSAAVQTRSLREEITFPSESPLAQCFNTKYADGTLMLVVAHVSAAVQTRSLREEIANDSEKARSPESSGMKCSKGPYSPTRHFAQTDCLTSSLRYRFGTLFAIAQIFISCLRSPASDIPFQYPCSLLWHRQIRS